jgi:predicted RND superfamily exporter protein
MMQINKIKPLHKYFLLLFYIFLLLATTGLIKWQLNNSMEIWFHNDDTQLSTHKKTLDEMGEWEWLVVVLESTTNIYDRNFLVELQSLGNRVAKLDNVRKIISIANARNTVDDGKGLEYRVIFNSDQNMDGALDERLRQALLNNPIYVDTIIKKGQENTTVLLVQDANDFDDGGPVRVNLVNSIKAIMSDAQSVADYSIVGTTALNATLNTYSLRDIYLFNPLVFSICIFFGWWVFGNWRDLAVALSVVSAVVSVTISSIVYSGIELNMATVMLPAFLISLSMAGVVHVITHFHQLCEKRPDASLYAIATEVVRDLWIPCLGSALTTIAGLLTLLFSGTTPIIQLGTFTAAGIFLGFVLNMTVVPLLLVYFWNGKAIPT